MAARKLKVGLAGAFGPFLVRALGATLRVRTVNPEIEARARADSGRVIYAFWHGNMLAPAYTHRGRGIGILVSQHADGEIIARIVRRLGFQPIRGSTTRGGAAGLLGLIGHAGGADLAITPDGPRGPRGTVHPGVAYLSGAVGVPVLPAGVAIRPAWRARSWDGFLVPRPFARVVYAFAEPVAVPPELPEADLAPWIALIRRRIEEAQTRASAALAPAGATVSS